jgi:hypothetical protein
VYIRHVSNAVRLLESFYAVVEAPHHPTYPPRAVQPLYSSIPIHSILSSLTSSPHLILSSIAAAQHHVGRCRRLSNPTQSSATGCNSSASGLSYLELLCSCSVVPTKVASPTSISSAPRSDETVGCWGTDSSMLILNVARGSGVSRGRRRLYQTCCRQSRPG